MDTLRGFFVLEGLDGAGTTTQLRALSALFHITAEPTGGPVGSLIREILRGQFSADPWTLALLYAADRNDHVKEIRAWIKAGEKVLSDRYLYSSLAYQGLTCPWDDVAALNARFPHPECVIYIDTPPEECIRRIEHRGQKRELFEKLAFLRKVRDGYEKAFRTLPKDTELLRIDGTLSPEEIGREIRKSL